MKIEELESKLQALRNKWKNDYPKDVLDKRWTAFRVDKSLALHYKMEIEKIKSQQ